MAPGSEPLLLQQYQTGVIKATSSNCDPHLVDHSVLLVGFGKSRSRHSIPYWILKNSWGASWGEKVSVLYCRGDRAGWASPHLLVLMSINSLGLFPAAPREQCLRHHQVPTYCPSDPSSQEEAAASLLPSLSLPLSAFLLCQLPLCCPHPKVFTCPPDRLAIG